MFMLCLCYVYQMRYLLVLHVLFLTLSFEVEVVEESSPLSPLRDVPPNSFGQNTAEAVPNTLYYRSTEGKSHKRPTLEVLRMGYLPSQAADEVCWQ